MSLLTNHNICFNCLRSFFCLTSGVFICINLRKNLNGTTLENNSIVNMFVCVVDVVRVWGEEDGGYVSFLIHCFSLCVYMYVCMYVCMCVCVCVSVLVCIIVDVVEFSHSGSVKIRLNKRKAIANISIAIM